MMIKVSPFEYENLVRELYYRDLRQLDGLDNEQEAIQTLLYDRFRSQRLQTLFAQARAFWQLMFY